MSQTSGDAMLSILGLSSVFLMLSISSSCIKEKFPAARAHAHIHMTLPLLAPSGDCPSGWTAVPSPQPVPTNSDWATLYSEIERLYVRERRKLRYVMRYMDTTYGFKAT